MGDIFMDLWATRVIHRVVDESWTLFLDCYMSERLLLRSIIALDEVNQQPDESLINFYGRFYKNFPDIDRVTNGNVIRAFYRSLNLPNKEFKKLRNGYHVTEIVVFEELAIR